MSALPQRAVPFEQSPLPRKPLSAGFPEEKPPSNDLVGYPFLGCWKDPSAKRVSLFVNLIQNHDFPGSKSKNQSKF